MDSVDRPERGERGDGGDSVHTDVSVLRSLGELRAIEQQRVASEHAAIATALQAAQRARDEAARQAREVESIRLAAEREAKRAADQARDDAERQLRLAAEAVAATERAHKLIELDERRLAEELALRRAAMLRQRPRWMIAVTACALIGAASLGWLAADARDQAAALGQARDRAIAVAATAEQRADAAERRATAAETTARQRTDELARSNAALAAFSTPSARPEPTPPIVPPRSHRPGDPPSATRAHTAEPHAPIVVSPDCLDHALCN